MSHKVQKHLASKLKPMFRLYVLALLRHAFTQPDNPTKASPMEERPLRTNECKFIDQKPSNLLALGQRGLLALGCRPLPTFQRLCLTLSIRCSEHGAPSVLMRA